MEEVKQSESSEYGLEVNRLQVPCKRPVTGPDFERGIQQYDFSIGGRFAWRPSKSYFRVGLKLTTQVLGSPVPPLVQSGITFADNPTAAMFDNVYVKAGNADVSSIINFAGQAHQVKSRLSKSRAWLNGVGKSAFGCSADFQDRLNTYSDNGVSGEEHTVPTITSISLNTAAIAVLTTSTGVVVGTNTNFAADVLGQVIVIAGHRFIVVDYTDTENIKVSGSTLVTGATLGGTWANSWFEKPDSPPSEQVATQYFMYVPPVGIFDHDGLLGSGEYRIELNPNSRYKTSIIEALVDRAPTTDYDVVVESLEFYPCIEKANLAATGIERLFLTEQHIQTKALIAGTASSILDFTVPPSTMAITVFVQSNAAGTDNRVPTVKFKAIDGSEEDLTNIQLTYANVSKPSTNWTSRLASNTNFMTQRYLDSQIDSGMFYSAGGPESYPEWRKRGGLYHFDFSRDSEDRSTNLQIQMAFGNLSANNLCYICAHYRKTAVITMTAGRISNVQTLSV